MTLILILDQNHDIAFAYSLMNFLMPIILMTHIVPDGHVFVDNVHTEPGPFVAQPVKVNAHRIALLTSRRVLLHGQELVGLDVQKLLMVEERVEVSDWRAWRWRRRTNKPGWTSRTEREKCIESEMNKSL